MPAPAEFDVARMRLNADVAGLCRAVRDGSRETAWFAVSLLGDLGGETAGDFLLEVLERRVPEHPYLWLEAVRALGRMREQRAVPGLMRLLGSELENDGQREAVVAALVLIGAPDVVPVLLGWLTDGGGPRWTAVDVLTRLRAPQSVPLLLATLWELLPFYGEKAVQVLGAQRDPRTGPALLFLVDSEGSSPALRRAALHALAELPEDAWPPPAGWHVDIMLRRGLWDPDAETARLAAELMVRTHEGRSELRGVLLDYRRRNRPQPVPEQTVVQCCAVVEAHPEHFGSRHDYRDFGILHRLLTEAPAPLVRRAAAAAMAAVADEGAAATLVSALDDPRVSDSAALALARLPSPPLDDLQALLDPGASPAQRRGAALALGHSRCEAAAPLLMDALHEEGPLGPRVAAADALAALRHRPASTQLAALASDSEEAATLRARALRALGAIADPSALPAVLGGTRDTNEAVRIRAAQALGAFPVPEAAEALGALVSGDTSLDVARAAAESLGRIGAPASPVLARLADRLRGDVVHELVAALAACPGGEAVAALGRIAAATGSVDARLAAAEAL
ncbi:HEAT repeat domain-containing protein, partial [Streptomyces sp.]|uniref:HEAT repeat domain-containing protein n=1 Tax=Streptomyces sp. TaxID=1931 RepID=UPI002F93F82A